MVLKVGQNSLKPLQPSDSKLSDDLDRPSKSSNLPTRESPIAKDLAIRCNVLPTSLAPQHLLEKCIMEAIENSIISIAQREGSKSRDESAQHHSLEHNR